MKNITCTFKQTKSGYHQFTSPDVNGIIYFSAAAFAKDTTPGTLTIEGDFADVKPGRVPQDPAKLAEAATKAQEKADKMAKRAEALKAEVARLTAAATTDGKLVGRKGGRK